MSTRDQRDAVTRLWPLISRYCERIGIRKAQLLTGRYGIPLDGGKVMDRRGDRLLTREDLAALAGVHRDTIRKIEEDERSPSPAVLASLAEALACEPGSLFPDDGAVFPETA